MLDDALLRARIAFIRQGAETNRFHTQRTIMDNRVGYHSFNVMALAMLMTPSWQPDRQLALMKAAMCHDLAEHVTGDMPAPAKRAMGIREVMGAHEATLLEEVGLTFESHLTDEERRVLKLADAMDGAFFCIEEASLGNQRIRVAFGNFRSYIEELVPDAPVERAIVRYIDSLWSGFSAYAWTPSVP